MDDNYVSYPWCKSECRLQYYKSPMVTYAEHAAPSWPGSSLKRCQNKLLMVDESNRWKTCNLNLYADTFMKFYTIHINLLTSNAKAGTTYRFPLLVTVRSHVPDGSKVISHINLSGYHGNCRTVGRL